MSEKYFLGFDLGGTKIAAALLDKDFNVLSRVKTQSPAGDGSEAVYTAICKAIQSVCEDTSIDPSKLSAIGGCAPGPVDSKKGVVFNTPNLGFVDYPLKSKLENSFNVPVYIANDVNAGLYGELHFGAAKGMSNVLAISPGTGVGGAVIINGALYVGANGSAGEFGHMIVQPDGPLCGCGQRGCLEAIVSRTAISQQIASFVHRGRIPIVAEAAGSKLKKIKSGLIARAYNDGDEDVAAIVQHAAKYLGVGLANLVNAFNPEAVIIGGGLVEALPGPLLTISTRVMKEMAMPSNGAAVEVLAAALGDDAVIMGAAQLAREAAGV